MNGDSLELSQMMQQMERNLTSKISDVQTAVAGINGRFLTEVSGIKDTHNTFRLELLGDGGRVRELELAQAASSRRQWFISAGVVPVVAAIHYLADKVGLIKR